MNGAVKSECGISEKEITEYLKQEGVYRNLLTKQRTFLAEECRLAETAAGEWEELDKNYAAKLREEFLAEPARRLRDEENVRRIVRSSLWGLEPRFRHILICFYTERKDPLTIAKDLQISETTFWRWRRRAVKQLRTAAEESMRRALHERDAGAAGTAPDGNDRL